MYTFSDEPLNETATGPVEAFPAGPFFDPGSLETKSAEAFRALVYSRAAECPRDLPWRRTRDPWAILVSEVMLQQTQAPRVEPKFVSWMHRFPTPQSLAQAPLQEVLSLWSGLGYNRRALALVRTAAVLADQYEGRVPPDEASLRSLDGVGVYTARAVLAFAFDRPVAFLETNIRTVLLRHFFPGGDKVPDSALEPVSAALVDPADPARWYNALMDYGVALKKTEGNHSRKSASYRPQSPFRDSRRRLRGAVLKMVISGGSVREEAILASLPFSEERVKEAALSLVAEGFLRYGDGAYSAATESAKPT